jgi:Family of unknown function (DUF5681)
MSKFKSGQSANPSGRPKGGLNKATLSTQPLLDGEAEISGSEATPAPVGSGQHPVL